jgi:FdhE protein
VAESFLSRWFGGFRKSPPTVEEARAELDRLADERPAFRAPVLWLRALLPDLLPDAPRVPLLSPDQAREKLVAGVPLLRGETVSIDRKAFQRRWKGACDALESLQPDGTVAALAKAVRGGQLDPAAMVDAITSGRAGYVGERAAELNLDPNLTATLARYTLFPVFTALDTALAPLRQTVGWERGHCPTCGSWPLLGEFRGLDQSRYLRCGLCAAEWSVPRLLCPLCGCRDHDKLSLFQREGEDRFRAATCDVCRGYVKMATTLARLSPLSLLVADVAMLHLDLAVAERGYSPP